MICHLRSLAILVLIVSASVATAAPSGMEAEGFSLRDPQTITILYPNGNDSHSIVTKRLWEADLALEAIAEMMEEGPVTLRLQIPWKTERFLFSNDSYSLYKLSDVAVSISGKRAKNLLDTVLDYKKRQELEHGRYVGFTGHVRKTAKKLWGLPFSCQNVFAPFKR